MLPQQPQRHLGQFIEMLDDRVRFQRRHIATRRAKADEDAGHLRRAGGVTIRHRVSDQAALRHNTARTFNRCDIGRGIRLARGQRVGSDQ